MRARKIAVSLQLSPQSELSQILSHLERAQEAFEQGEKFLLFRGELPVDLPEGLRNWLIRTKQLP